MPTQAASVVKDEGEKECALCSLRELASPVSLVSFFTSLFSCVQVDLVFDKIQQGLQAAAEKEKRDSKSKEQAPGGEHKEADEKEKKEEKDKEKEKKEEQDKEKEKEKEEAKSRNGGKEKDTSVEKRELIVPATVTNFDFLQKVAEELVNQAIERKSLDNVTVMIVLL